MRATRDTSPKPFGCRRALYNRGATPLYSPNDALLRRVGNSGPGTALMFDFPKQHEFLVGIDSDGCAFDTMEVKHKECFIPNTINCLRTARHQPIRARGGRVRQSVFQKPRHQSLSGTDRNAPLACASGPRCRRAESTCAIPDGLVRWMERETKLANPALAAAVQATGDADLKQALEWSQAVNESVAKIVRGVPPFPFLRESLEKLLGPGRHDRRLGHAARSARCANGKSTDLDKFIRAIGGQEIGAPRKKCSRSPAIIRRANR